MPAVKLTKDKVCQIIALRKCKDAPSLSAIARMFGVHHTSILHIVRGRTKMQYPGDVDRTKLAEQLRELAEKIESGEIALT